MTIEAEMIFCHKDHKEHIGFVPFVCFVAYHISLPEQ